MARVQTSRHFCCYARDIRYTIPTLHFIVAMSAERACELARRELLEEPYVTAVEVYDGGRLVKIVVLPDPSGPTPDNPKFD
jgi:hypothetical protein